VLKSIIATAGLVLMGAAGGSDERVSPPVERSFASPAGHYRLVVTPESDWHSPKAKARFSRVDGAGKGPLWEIALPHRFGPRTAIASDLGTVVLFDEWVRTPSSLALVVLGKDGRTLAHYGFTDIAALTGIAPDVLVKQATIGAWMARAPAWSPDGRRIHVWAGTVRLSVDPATGKLVRG
jgi:hypothetical protein